MSFILGIALLLFGTSFTNPDASTTVLVKAHSLPSINERRGNEPLTINSIGVEISRTF